MPVTKPYHREKAVAYAARWAFSRNPRYLSFDGIGGDCTSFVSQCLYAGGGVMNYTPDVGWYYNNPTDRAAAWSGVAYLYGFLLGNRSVGPYAHSTDMGGVTLGDIIQLGDGTKWYHSLLVTGFRDRIPLVTTHTFDVHQRPLTDYTYAQARFLHIDGIRTW